MAAKRTRMSASERREQLIAVARGLFAERGFDATSVEEVAARAQVSKPVVYEHFGGKEGLYAVIVDRELTTISTTITRALGSSSSASVTVERAALALLTYIEDSPDGFRILSAARTARPAPTPRCWPTSPSRSPGSSPRSSPPTTSTRARPRCTPRCWWVSWPCRLSGGWRTAR